MIDPDDTCQGENLGINMLTHQYSAHCSHNQRDKFLGNLSHNGIVGKLFKGEMFTRTLPTILLQIFCKIISISEVIIKSIIDTDDNY